MGLFDLGYELMHLVLKLYLGIVKDVSAQWLDLVLEVFHLFRPVDVDLNIFW